MFQIIQNKNAKTFRNAALYIETRTCPVWGGVFILSRAPNSTQRSQSEKNN